LLHAALKRKIRADEKHKAGLSMFTVASNGKLRYKEGRFSSSQVIMYTLCNKKIHQKARGLQ